MPRFLQFRSCIRGHDRSTMGEISVVLPLVRQDAYAFARQLNRYFLLAFRMRYTHKVVQYLNYNTRRPFARTQLHVNYVFISLNYFTPTHEHRKKQRNKQEIKKRIKEQFNIHTLLIVYVCLYNVRYIAGYLLLSRYIFFFCKKGTRSVNLLICGNILVEEIMLRRCENE